MRSVENALTLTDLLISKHFNAFIQVKIKKPTVPYFS